MKQHHRDPGLSHKQNPPLHRSFAFALSGIGVAFLRERNLRVHLAVGMGALYFSRYFHLSRGEMALLILTIGVVMTCELLNTAIENLVDLVSPQAHPLAKSAKDVAAGAVLVAALASVCVGFCLFGDWEILTQIGQRLLQRPVPYCIALAAALLWIILPGRSRHPVK